MESAVPQRSILHFQYECKLDEGRARDPVWLRFPPPLDESLAAGTGPGPRGAFGFDPGVTALNPAAIEAASDSRRDPPSFENGWNGLAGFLLGTPHLSGKSSQYIKMNSMENQYALYVRDRWRATPKLTLNLGLRWELYPNRTRSRRSGYRIV